MKMFWEQLDIHEYFWDLIQFGRSLPTFWRSILSPSPGFCGLLVVYLRTLSETYYMSNDWITKSNELERS
jgi:hypothetical protein